MADDEAQEIADRERIFKHFDANGDGKISAAELRDSLRALGCLTDEVTYMIAEMDTDGNGYISYKEYNDFAIANRGLMKDVAKIL